MDKKAVDEKTIQKFRSWRDSSGVAAAIKRLQHQSQSLDTVLQLLDDEGYRPSVTKFGGITILYFLTETKRNTVTAHSEAKPVTTDYSWVTWENKLAEWLRKKGWLK